MPTFARTAVTIVSIVVAVDALLVMYGAWRWQTGTHKLRARLQAAALPIAPATVSLRELDGLPDPVQRYLRLVLKEGQPLVASARVHQRGTFNMGQSTKTWRSFRSDQWVVTRRPGFDWDARIRVAPGMAVRVHDAYVAGEGILQAAVFGVLPVANLRGTSQVAEGELMRFLAEAAWYPTALLPSQGVQWRPVDERSAQATLSDGTIGVTLLFIFAEAGFIETVRAEARGRLEGERIVPTPWYARVWNYQERGGMLVPLDGEVAWVLPEGIRPYWRGHLEDIAYEFARGR